MKIEDITTGERRVHILVYIALAIIALALSIVSYWLFTPKDVLEIKNNPVPVRTVRKHPTADGVIILKVNFCKKVGAYGRVRVSFVSQSRELFLPITVDTSPPRCEEAEVPILIPHETPPGTYVIRYLINYRINPLKSAVEEFDSQPFEVK